VHGGNTWEQIMGFGALDALYCKTEVADCLYQDSKSKNITWIPLLNSIFCEHNMNLFSLVLLLLLLLLLFDAILK
jgi:hypothetical protein